MKLYLLHNPGPVCKYSIKLCVFFEESDKSIPDIDSFKFTFGMNFFTSKFVGYGNTNEEAIDNLCDKLSKLKWDYIDTIISKLKYPDIKIYNYNDLIKEIEDEGL